MVCVIDIACAHLSLQQPDFKQTGDRLSSIVDELFERSLEISVLGKGPRKMKWKVGQSRGNMTLCFDEELVRQI